MSQGDKLKLQRGAAANTEFEVPTKGAENRHHNRDGTAATISSLSQHCGNNLSKDKSHGSLC